MVPARSQQYVLAMLRAEDGPSHGCGAAAYARKTRLPGAGLTIGGSGWADQFEALVWISHPTRHSKEDP
jgi:hypothetical protein